MTAYRNVHTVTRAGSADGHRRQETAAHYTDDCDDR